jgi:DNA polymerase-3 subunit epsilon
MFHCYLHPERSIPADALAVHGLSAEFLADKPLFAAVVDEFLAFVGDAPLVAHSAGFDIAFLNSELTRIAKPPIAVERVIDTLAQGFCRSVLSANWSASAPCSGLPLCALACWFCASPARTFPGHS